jgi:hypothetical protein
MSDLRTKKDVHTEHCCALHGCKYSWQRQLIDECTVVSSEKPQSHMCYYCSDWLEENWDIVLLLNAQYDFGFDSGYARGLGVVEVR